MFIDFPGHGLMLPTWHNNSASGVVAPFTSMVVDASGEKAAFAGRILWKDRRTLTKTINKVGFRFGTVDKAAGSTLRVSLQDLSEGVALLTPDGTADHFRVIANADATFASNTWHTTGLLTTDGTDGGGLRNVTYGDRIAVVIEFSSFVSADDFQVNSITASGGSGEMHGAAATNFTTVWVRHANHPNVVFEFSDGTYGYLGPRCSALSGMAAVSYSASSTPDEYAIGLKFARPVVADGIYCHYLIAPATDHDADFVLYDDTTTLAAMLFHKSEVTGGGVAGAAYRPFDVPILLRANKEYLVSVRPASTGSYGIGRATVANNGYFSYLGCTITGERSRTNLGAWSGLTDTSAPMLSLCIGRMLAGVYPGYQLGL